MTHRRLLEAEVLLLHVVRLILPTAICSGIAWNSLIVILASFTSYPSKEGLSDLARFTWRLFL